MRSVAVAPADDSLDWNNLAEIGDIASLGAGATNVEDKYPTWGQASTALVYWLDKDFHRRFNLLQIADADPANLAADVGANEQEASQEKIRDAVLVDRGQGHERKLRCYVAWLQSLDRLKLRSSSELDDKERSS